MSLVRYMQSLRRLQRLIRLGRGDTRRAEMYAPTLVPYGQREINSMGYWVIETWVENEPWAAAEVRTMMSDGKITNDEYIGLIDKRRARKIEETNHEINARKEHIREMLMQKEDLSAD